MTEGTRSIKVDIGPHGSVDIQLARIVKEFCTRVGVTARTRAQQIINEEMNDRTGKLRTRTNFEVKVQGGNVLLEFYNDAGEYAGFQEYGTGRYGPKKKDITPKHGKLLSWIDPDTKERRFARSVKGVPPKRFMHRAIEFAIDQEVRRQNQ